MERSPKVWDLCLEHEELLRLADEQVPVSISWDVPSAALGLGQGLMTGNWNFWSLLETREVWGEISSHCNLIVIHQVHREPPPRNLSERDHSWGC